MFSSMNTLISFLIIQKSHKIKEETTFSFPQEAKHTGKRWELVMYTLMKIIIIIHSIITAVYKPVYTFFLPMLC